MKIDLVQFRMDKQSRRKVDLDLHLPKIRCVISIGSLTSLLIAKTVGISVLYFVRPGWIHIISFLRQISDRSTVKNCHNNILSNLDLLYVIYLYDRDNFSV